MNRNRTWWTVITTLSLVGCTTSGPKLMTRLPAGTATLQAAASPSERGTLEPGTITTGAAARGAREELADKSSQPSSSSSRAEELRGTDVVTRVPLVRTATGQSAGGAAFEDEDTLEFHPAGRAELTSTAPEKVAASGLPSDDLHSTPKSTRRRSQVAARPVIDSVGGDGAGEIRTVSAQVDALRPQNLKSSPDGLPPSPMNGRDLYSIEVDIGERPLTPPSADAVELTDVIQSIYQSYPLLEAAIFGRNIAAGEQLAAEGAYDLKLKAGSETMPLGYYRNYRHSMGLEQDLFHGGQVFGGYRLGRGEIQPWYQERVTNDGGEFMAGVMMPLAQNRAIDPRRAALWKATYGRSAVEPAIQSQLIRFVYGGSLAYWNWVAAGQAAQFAEQLYDLALQRNDQLETLVDGGALPEAILIDNRRLIVSRQVKLIDARRRLQQTAVRLSLFLRTADGEPYIPREDQLPFFPGTFPVDESQVPMDITEALSRRPELRELDFSRRIVEIDLALAHNQTQPAIDATLRGSQDVGGFSSPKGDKQPLEVEGMVYFSMPLQRRAAQGKIHASEGKIAQINIKRQFLADQIETEVRNATIALTAAYNAIGQARRSVVLNEQMQELEAIALEGGASDLLRLNLREEQTFDAKVTEVEALLRYFEAQAELRAAIGFDADGLNAAGMPQAP